MVPACSSGLQPDPSKLFVVEGDALNTSVAVALCLLLLQPIPAERNYSTGNQELLAVKLAWEEWRQWLEGVEQPFVVWTDN